jgi:hypothetical protein
VPGSDVPGSVWGRYVIPRSDVPARYRRIRFAAMRCREHGFALYSEHCVVVCIISGLVTHAPNMRPPVILAYSMELTGLSTSVVFVSLIEGSDGVETGLQSGMVIGRFYTDRYRFGRACAQYRRLSVSVGWKPVPN